MNYGISVLFRAIPLVMALFCFLRRLHLPVGRRLFADDRRPGRFLPRIDLHRTVCDGRHDHPPDHPHVQSVRQVFSADSRILRSPRHVHLRHRDFQKTPKSPNFFVAGHIVCGLGLITGCVATAATVSTRFSLIPENSTSPSREINAKGFTQQQEPDFSNRSPHSSRRWPGPDDRSAGRRQHASFRSRSVMGGIACICTSLIALVASIVRQEERLCGPGKKDLAETGADHGHDRHDLGTDRDLRLLRPNPRLRRIRPDRPGPGLLQHFQQGHLAG